MNAEAARKLAHHEEDILKPVDTASPEGVLDIEKIREDFPILKRLVHGKRLVYLDNAATTQKPRSVIDALSGYYENYNANVHRGIHTLAEEATAAYESTRSKAARFIGSTAPEQVIFTRGTTESINMVASGWGDNHVQEGDEILLTEMEHHANLVPWIMLAKRKGARLRHIPITPDGRLDLSNLNELIGAKTKIVSLTHMSNVLGTLNPVADIAERAHKVGAVVVVDGAQSVPHIPIDVNALGIDCLAFSAHKMLGPTGVGVLWATEKMYEQMEPHLGGGEMIETVKLDDATWAELPHKFEAGTPNIADVVAFGAAIDYLSRIGMDNAREHDRRLIGYALERMKPMQHLKVFGPDDPAKRSGVISFADDQLHPMDISTILDHRGVAVRAGHHCAQPLMGILNVPSTARASFYIYNDTDDIDFLVESLVDARKYFGLGD